MKPLRCIMEGNSIAIEVDLDRLKFATEHHPALYDGEHDRGTYLVTDCEEFAKSVVFELSREEEDGSTLISALFDAAILTAISQGAEGVKER